MYGAAVVVCETEILQVKQDEFAARYGDIFVRAVRGETADAIVNRRCGCSVVNVNKTIRCVVGIESNTQQPALTNGVDRQSYKRSWQYDAIFDNPQFAGLLANEDSSVGVNGHRGRVG